MAVIESAEVFVTSPGRNFVTLKITTSDGVTGLGDATLNGRELAVAAYLRDHVVPLLIGRDPARIEDTWQYLYRGAYWRRGPVTMTAIAAVDMALWDIKGKVAGHAGLPAARRRARARRAGLRPRHGSDLPSLFDLDRAPPRAGLQGDPGPDRGARPRAGATAWRDQHGQRYDYEPAKRTAVPDRGDLGHRAPTCATCPPSSTPCASEFGYDFPLLHDVHHRLTPIEAARSSASRSSRTTCSGSRTARPARTRRRSAWSASTPRRRSRSARSSTRSGTTSTLITEQLIDYVRTAVTHTGGITALKKLMDFAALYQVKSGFHGPTDLSPVGLAAALHLDLAIHNFGIQEYMPHTDETAGRVPHQLHVRGRAAPPGRGPGPGRRVRRRTGGRTSRTRRPTCRSTGSSSTARCTTGSPPCSPSKLM